MPRMSASSSDTLRTATNRFVCFFRELSEAFIEREDVLQQVALALLSREHVLMTGPPGTAKSKLAHSVLGRILSEETGQPSLFARQFTESTVQTDLVGPIDFKTLMDTGHTEHFTDEGMLGSVHAFLDEVFDGRDMLLRSALNLLNERELKQGSRITRGRIECALMTTNRYLAEVLENERLLAFVDRIAFLAFVPKGFSAPGGLEQVLLAQVAGRKPRPLKAPLSIQDLDVLQDAVERIFIDDDICSRMATLVQMFETELAETRRADPTFVPSRYLSTRTVVRMGSLLRAACFFDWAFRGSGRPLRVLPEDLGMLRLGLTLSGPSTEQVVRLLERETDPRERRQLTIVRTEREVFDRCLAGLPPPARRPAPRSIAPELLQQAAPAALPAAPTADLLKLAEQLARASTAGQAGADEAAARLDNVLRELVERALSAGLLLGAGDATDPVAGAQQLAELADAIEQADATNQRAARWLRGRVLGLLHETIAFGAAPLGQAMAEWQASLGDLKALRLLALINLMRAEQLKDLRQSLRHSGADESQAAAHDAAWKASITALESRLQTAIGPGTAAAVQSLLAIRPTASPDERLSALAPVIEVMSEVAARLHALGGDGRKIVAAVAGPPLKPLAEALLGSGPAAASPEEAARRLEKHLASLGEAGVLELLPDTDLMAWMARELLRAGDGNAPRPGGAKEPVMIGERELMRMVSSGTVAYQLTQLSMRALPELRGYVGAPDKIVERVAELVSALPRALNEELVARDVGWVDRPLSRLEAWWSTLASALGSGEGGLQEAVQSRFFELTQDRGVLARLALEAKLSATVFRGADVSPLLGRIEALSRESTEVAARLLAMRGQRTPAAKRPIRPA